MIARLDTQCRIEQDTLTRQYTLHRRSTRQVLSSSFLGTVAARYAILGDRTMEMLHRIVSYSEADKRGSVYGSLSISR